MTPVRTSRRLIVMAAALSPAAAFAQGTGTAGSFPSKPVRIIVGLAAGSAADALGRAYAQAMAEVLGISVYVDNKPGAGQIAAINALQMAPPDGHTLYLGVGSGLSQGPGIRKDLPYDPLKAFSFIAQVGSAAGAIYVHPDVPVKSVAELVAYAKANPGKLSYGSAGIGSAGHLGAELFMNLTGAKLFHVPYRSDPEAAREVAAGSIQVGFTIARAMAPLAEANKVRPIMVIGSQRLSYLPNVPHAGESGIKDAESIGPFTYYGFVGPAGMAPALVDQLNAAFHQASSRHEMVTQL